MCQIANLTMQSKVCRTLGAWVVMTLRRYGCFAVFLAVGLFACFLESVPQGYSEPHGWVAVLAGMLPIILAAPHGGRQPIPGVPVRSGAGVFQFATGRDNNTDELAAALALKLEERLQARPFLVVARFERKHLDANRSPDRAYESTAAKPYYDAYHGALGQAREQVRREWGRGLLLDIHGQGTHAEAIYRGTGNGKTVAALTQRFGVKALTGSKSIFSQLEGRGYQVLPSANNSYREDRYVGGYTVQTYGSHRDTGIDAIQLEIGMRLRARPNLERTAADLAEAIAVFAQEYLPIERLTALETAARYRGSVPLETFEASERAVLLQPLVKLLK
jgi:N-formylglutamate amidohydrolase